MSGSDSRESQSGSEKNEKGNQLSGKTIGYKKWGKFKLRRYDDDGEQDWWFASTAIPLLAATIAPVANVFSIAALVSYWRTSLVGPNGQTLPQLAGIDIKDPKWVYDANLTSLVTGYIGNVSLFLNFTNRVPYILALPVTIFLWFTSTTILTAIQICMSVYAPPGPNEVYTEAFWYGIIASVLYFMCACILLVNMLGYFLGHYPQHFNLTEAQRTLILQTFLFFIWLAGGAGIFSAVQERFGEGETWNFSDAMYFCDVTILTIGFGDLTPNNNVGRGLILPYSVGGIIMLGLMISSITTFAKEMTQTNVVQKRVERQRERTANRTVRSSMEAERIREKSEMGEVKIIMPPENDTPDSGTSGDNALSKTVTQQTLHKHASLGEALKRTGTNLMQHAHHEGKHNRKSSLIVLREEKDRFLAMRKIQHDSDKFKRYSALVSSFTVLILLWFIGALVFWQIEKDYQGWTYFDGIYFCYVSLLTVGYGDITPKTNAGRPFFVVWSLLAVPSITILITDLADTVINSFKNWTNAVGDFTLLAKDGIWKDFYRKNSWLFKALESRRERKSAEKRIEEGFPIDTSPDTDENYHHDSVTERRKTLEELILQREVKRSLASQANKLANTMKSVAVHVKDEKPRKYTYEEWVEFTDLMRFTRHMEGDDEEEEDESEGLLEWDWIGAEGPIFSKNEAQWVLERLCESMGRYVRKTARATDGHFGTMKRANTIDASNEAGGTKNAETNATSNAASKGNEDHHANSMVDIPSPAAEKLFTTIKFHDQEHEKEKEKEKRTSHKGKDAHRYESSDDEEIDPSQEEWSENHWHNGKHTPTKPQPKYSPESDGSGSKNYVGNALYMLERPQD